MDFHAAKNYILNRLETELSPSLKYHCFAHTLDVLNSSIRIAQKEGVQGLDLVLLKTAALYHDSGFVHNVHSGHELKGCEIARQNLGRFGYSKEHIEDICTLIMATKIPQTPTNFLAKILCDADLDYLGRDDFYTISNLLFEELKLYSQIKDDKDWNRLQVSFISSHNYFTKTNILDRDPKKIDVLDRLIRLVEKQG